MIINDEQRKRRRVSQQQQQHDDSDGGDNNNKHSSKVYSSNKPYKLKINLALRYLVPDAPAGEDNQRIQSIRRLLMRHILLMTSSINNRRAIQRDQHEQILIGIDNYCRTGELLTKTQTRQVYEREREVDKEELKRLEEALQLQVIDNSRLSASIEDIKRQLDDEEVQVVKLKKKVEELQELQKVLLEEKKHREDKHAEELKKLYEFGRSNYMNLQSSMHRKFDELCNDNIRLTKELDETRSREKECIGDSLYSLF